MKNYSIFKGITELRGDASTFRIEGSKVFEKRDNDFLFIGYLPTANYRSNIILYEAACDLSAKRRREGL